MSCVGDVILTYVAVQPVAEVEEAVVEGQENVCDQPCTEQVSKLVGVLRRVNHGFCALCSRPDITLYQGDSTAQKNHGSGHWTQH